MFIEHIEQTSYRHIVNTLIKTKFNYKQVETVVLHSYRIKFHIQMEHLYAVAH